MTRDPFAGAWRIVWMRAWDPDYVDLDGPAHVTFGAGRSGAFESGMVQGHFYFRLGDDSAFRAVRQSMSAHWRKTAR